MLNKSPVKYKKTTHRAVNPEQTLSKVSEITMDIGLTRTSEITHLDRLNIPVYTSVRPLAEIGAVSVYAGKGPTPIHAKVSSIMESVERFSAEKQEDDETIVKEFDSCDCVNPYDLILPQDSTYTHGMALEWNKAYSIKDDREVFVPSNAVYHPYNSEQVTHLFASNTNGLASGNTLEESVFHGLMEVVERDAWSLFEAFKRNVAEIDCENCDNKYILELIDKFNSKSVSLKLLDLTVDNEICTVGAVSEDLSLKDPALLTLGIGTHLNPEIAVIRAITEVAQSRATQIHGTREDTTRANMLRDTGYERMKRINNHWFRDSDNVIELNDICDKSTDSFREDIEVSMRLLKKSGVTDAYYVDLTRGIDIPVSRVIVPGLEVYSVDSSRIGKRLKPDYLL